MYESSKRCGTAAVGGLGLALRAMARGRCESFPPTPNRLNSRSPPGLVFPSLAAKTLRVADARILLESAQHSLRSGGACRCARKGQKTNWPLDNPSRQGLGDSPDATLLHRTFRWPVPATG